MDNFINNVINTWGNGGAVWLDNLANIIGKLSIRWGLKDILALPNLSYGFVAQATQNHKSVILKITYDSIVQEYLTLKYNNGCGMISVIDIDSELNALLLERASPGVSLNSRENLSILDKISIYSKVVNKIASIPLRESHSYTHIMSWCDILIKEQHEKISKKLSEKAIALDDYLLKTSKNEYLCHGDLHLDNILQSKDWVAIDPKGVIAEKEFEVAAFNLLTNEEIKKKVNISKKIMVRIHSLSMQFGFVPQRLLAWIYIRSMLSARWSIEDNGSPANKIFIAEQIYPLLKLDY